ncbi:MAG: hypothetical protein HDQ87_11330 [Clostridia bacterium]|nr:hypothetical protein [Clostridia bacterium]
MTQLEALWVYQTAEIELEQLERFLKNTETRKRLVKQQQVFKTNQSHLKKIEQESVLTKNSLVGITAQIERLRRQIKEKNVEILEIHESDLEDLFPEDIHEMMKECESIRAAIEANKQQLMEIIQSLEQSKADIEDTLVKMSRAKKQFDELKAAHAKELQAGRGDLRKRRQIVDQAAQQVPRELLDRYRRIKQHRPNPVAYLKNKRCQGCNMEVPSGVLQDLQSGDRIVVCENCGRILLVAPEEENG